MIGGARSAKSPRDQAYIYFACFEGRAAGGCRERERERDGIEEGERETERGGYKEEGRKGGPRTPQQCAAYGACSSRATRDAVQLPAASSVGSRTKPRAPRARATGSPLSFSPLLFPVPRIAAPLCSKMCPAASSSCSAVFPLPPPPRALLRPFPFELQDADFRESNFRGAQEITES